MMSLPFVNKDTKPILEKSVEKSRKFEKVPLKAIITWTGFVILLVLLTLMAFRLCEFYSFFESKGKYYTDNDSNLMIPNNSLLHPTTKPNFKDNEASGDSTPSEIEKINFKISPENLCDSGNEEDTKLLILVTSKVDNFDLRQAIRLTWGSMANRKESPIRLAFVLGTTNNITASLNIQEECNKNKDIIQVDLLDLQKYLTLKSISSLKWASENCPQAQFLLKTDDNVFVNFGILADILNSKVIVSPEHYIVGFIQKDSYPDRNENSDEYVSTEVYPDDAYPPHISGSAYITPGHTVPELLKTSLQMSPLPLGDAFITGICAQKLGAVLVHDDMFRLDNPSPEQDIFKDLATSAGHIPDELFVIWQQLTAGAEDFFNDTIRNLHPKQIFI